MLNQLLSKFAEYGIVPLMLDYAAQMRHSALSAPAEIY